MAGRLDRAEYEGSHALAHTCGRRQYADLVKNPRGYCPNHATGVRLPDDFVVTPLQYVD